MTGTNAPTRLRVLLVEDNDGKAREVCTLLAKLEPTVDIAHSRTMVEGVASAYEGDAFDLMIVDLMLPMREGVEPSDSGGSELLRSLEKGRGAAAAGHIVALTAYEDLAEAQAVLLGKYGVSVMRWGASVDWENDLARLVVRILDNRERRIGAFELDVLMLTALHEVELEAVLALDCGWSEHLSDTGRYDGAICHGDRRLACSAIACPEMGMPMAAAIASKYIASLRPRAVVMVGIAAGISHGLEFGDVIVADEIWDYGAGKILRDGRRSQFAPAPSHRRTDARMLRQARAVALSGWGLAARVSWGSNRGPAPAKAPTVRVGPFASGAAVVQDDEVVGRIRAVQRKVLALDMEAYGVVVATQVCTDPVPRVMVCKSVCDFADMTKGDDYQRYAAYTSASFAYEVLSRYGVG